ASTRKSSRLTVFITAKSLRVSGSTRSGSGARPVRRSPRSWRSYWPLLNKRSIMNQIVLPRRHFLADMGMGFTGVVLGAMLAEESRGQSPSRQLGPHFPAKAKSVIWIFLCGGVSHVESFDVK